jgi:TolA-binding protein
MDAALLRVRDVETENRALWNKVGELEGNLAQLEGRLADRAALRQELEMLLRSRPFALAERLASLRRLQGGRTDLSRARLRQLLEEQDRD